MLALLTRTPVIRLSTESSRLSVEKGAFVYYADTGESMYFDGATLIPLPTIITGGLNERLTAITNELTAIRRGVELAVGHELLEG